MVQHNGIPTADPRQVNQYGAETKWMETPPENMKTNETRQRESKTDDSRDHELELRAERLYTYGTVCETTFVEFLGQGIVINLVTYCSLIGR